jgi:hypothetical protein
MNFYTYSKPTVSSPSTIPLSTMSSFMPVSAANDCNPSQLNEMRISELDSSFEWRSTHPKSWDSSTRSQRTKGPSAGTTVDPAKVDMLGRLSHLYVGAIP